MPERKAITAEIAVIRVGVIQRIVVPLARLEPNAPSIIARRASMGLFPWLPINSAPMAMTITNAKMYRTALSVKFCSF